MKCARRAENAVQIFRDVVTYIESIVYAAGHDQAFAVDLYKLLPEREASGRHLRRINWQKPKSEVRRYLKA